MTFVSYAQNFEDVVLWRALNDVREGRYVDVGAQDPEMDSVSLAFYKAGWRGIHVDPIPSNAERLRRARRDETVIEAAVTDAEGPIPFFELGGLSSGRDEIAEHHRRGGHEPQPILVPTVRLQQLLDLIEGEIHWLKIDVEGMEADVLRSWGDSAKRPWVVVVESTFPTTQEPTEHLWIHLVRERGYKEVLFDGLSRFFVHEAHDDIAGRLNHPANVFDEFQVSTRHFSASMVRQEIEDRRKDADERIGLLSSEVLGFREQLRDAEARLSAERERLAAAEQKSSVDIAEIRGRLQATEGELERERARLDRQERDSRAQIEEARSKSAAQIDEVRSKSAAQINELRSKSAAEIEEARSNIARLDSALTSRQAKLAQLEAELSDASDKIDDVNVRWAAEREARAAVESELRKIATLFGNNAENLADFARGNHSVALGTTYAALKARMAVAREELDLTREFAVRQFASGRKSRDHEVNSLQRRVSVLDTQNLEATRRTEILEAAAESLRTEALELQAALADARLQISLVYNGRRGRLLRRLGLIPARRAADHHTPPSEHWNWEQKGDNAQQHGMEIAVSGIRHTSNLLALNGSVFVDAVYRTFLKRSADRAGRDHFVGRLQQGDPKEDVLLAIATSQEARAAGANIEGLADLEEAQARASGWFGRRQNNRDRGLIARLNRLEYTIGEAHNALLMRLERIETSLEQLQSSGIGSGSRNGFAAIERAGQRAPASIKRGISIEAANGASDFIGALGQQLNSSAEAQTLRAK